ncbi:unnamed protein product [Ilex paraguariensis]|uniref:Tr-type G domain-containing protein n=1 Tax=Ilex paraguariensis TaxID=185542 RepID=A0ABC8UFQ4_9AQUA
MGTCGATLANTISGKWEPHRGHKSYVPNMISGASQADIGVLVISARKGEFETGYERGGQTREHVQLAKTLGVSKLLVVVNKMDDHTVNWSKQRYDEIESKMIPFLKSSGYNVKKDVQFLPISGLVGLNMNRRVDKSVCSWWNGPCLFEALDAVEVLQRDPKGPFRKKDMIKEWAKGQRVWLVADNVYGLVGEFFGGAEGGEATIGGNGNIGSAMMLHYKEIEEILDRGVRICSLGNFNITKYLGYLMVDSYMQLSCEVHKRVQF